MYSSNIFFSYFWHRLTSKTNNKALIQKTSQYSDMRYIVTLLGYFPATLNKNMTRMVAAQSCHPATLSCKLKYSSLLLEATFWLLWAETLNGLRWNIKWALSNCAPTHSRPLQATPTHSNPLQATPTNSSHFNPLHAVLTHCKLLHLLQTTLKTQPHAIRNHSLLPNTLQKIFEFYLFVF